MAKYGFVYCLMNSSMPNLYKIGCTEKSPQARADDLSRSTGVPSEFYVVCYIECENYQKVEREIHLILDEHRSNSRREFFNAPLEKIAASFFYHRDGISWVDRLAYENTHVEAYKLENPYEVQAWQAIG